MDIVKEIDDFLANMVMGYQDDDVAHIVKSSRAEIVRLRAEVERLKVIDNSTIWGRDDVCC